MDVTAHAVLLKQPSSGRELGARRSQGRNGTEQEAHQPQNSCQHHRQNAGRVAAPHQLKHANPPFKPTDSLGMGGHKKPPGQPGVASTLEGFDGAA